MDLPYKQNMYYSSVVHQRHAVSQIEVGFDILWIKQGARQIIQWYHVTG